MRFHLTLSALAGTHLKWALPAALALAIGLAAAACFGGQDEVYTAEPFGTIAFTSDRDGNDEIYVMAADGSAETNVTANEAIDSEPSWSPDGSRLAFSSFRAGTSNLHVMNADGSDIQQLTDNPAVDGGVRWSADGNRIAFYSFRDQSRQLMWIMNADGSDIEPVLEAQIPGPQTSCSGGFPGSWFPDGQRLLFRGSEGGDVDALQICSVALDGSDLQIILSEEQVHNHFPSLSPDGRKIAFTSSRDGNTEIYVMNVDGGRLRRLTDHLSVDQYPAWSPDGQWIAFQSDRDGDMEIYVMRPDGSDLRQLTHNDDSDRQPSWSPQ